MSFTIQTSRPTGPIKPMETMDEVALVAGEMARSAGYRAPFDLLRVSDVSWRLRLANTDDRWSSDGWVEEIDLRILWTGSVEDLIERYGTYRDACLICQEPDCSGFCFA